MKRVRIVGVLVLVCGISAVLWQRSALADLRWQNGALRELEAESARLAAENESWRAAQSASAVAGVAPELLRLRGEVGRLRSQKNAVDALRKENEQLANERLQQPLSAEDFVKHEGFLAKESWAPAGHNSPEDTLQTFFWAIREGNIGQLAECMSSSQATYLKTLEQPENAEERERTIREYQEMTQSVGIRIMERKIHSYAQPVAGEALTERIPSEVSLRIQAVAGGISLALRLKLYPDGWKVKEIGKYD